MDRATGGKIGLLHFALSTCGRVEMLAEQARAVRGEAEQASTSKGL
jgi:hypothetical protein